MRIIKWSVMVTAALLCLGSSSFAEMTVMSLQERMRQADTIVIGEIQEVHQTDAGAGGQPPLPTEHWLAACRVERYIIGPKIHNPNVEEGKAVSLIPIAFDWKAQKPTPVKLVTGKKYLLFLKEIEPQKAGERFYEMITPYHGAFEAGQDHFIHDEQSPEYPKAVKMSFEEILQRVTPQSPTPQQPLKQVEANSPLALTIHSDKEVYEAGDDITIALEFRNSSGDTKTLKFDKGNRLHTFFSFELSRDGNKIKAYRDIDTKDMSFPIEERKLASGETYSMSMVINRLDWNRQDWPQGSPFDKKGRYEIRVTYFGASAAPEDNVISNTIAIQIKGKNIFGWTRNVGVTSAAEASEQQVVYTDMIEAYEQGRYPDARALLRRHLERFTALMTNARNDLDADGTVRTALGIIRASLEAENGLNPDGRLGPDAGLLFYLKEVLLQARDTYSRFPNIPGPVRVYIEGETGSCASLWIRAGQGLISRAELEKFYGDFEKELKGKGLKNFDEIR